MGLAPNPKFPETAGHHYDVKTAPNTPGGRGPLRFEEGIVTDTSVPADFSRGVMEVQKSAPGRQNHVDPATQFKHADETLRERSHLGSASWTDSNDMRGNFAHGSFTDAAEVKYEEVTRSGGRQARSAPSRVTD